MDIDEETSEEYRPDIKQRFIKKYRHELFDYYTTFEDNENISFNIWAETLDLESLKEIVGEYLN